MPFAVGTIGAGLATAAAGSAAGALVSSALAPGTSGGSGGGGGNYYIPTGLANTDQSWQNLFGQQGAAQGQVYGTIPYYQQSLNNGLNANQQYGGAYQNAANAAGSQYGALGQQLQGAAGQQFGAQTGLLNAGQQLYQTSLDPQNALYNRTVQQLQDQTGATNSMYGLGSSAAGAGVANQALGNFNIDWQNQQLQRQATGLQGYGAAIGQAGQAAGQGGALGGAGAGYTLQGGQTPYSTAQGIAAYPGQLGGQYASQIESGPLSSGQALGGQAIQYMNYGQGAQSVPYQQQAAGAGAAGALASQGINSLGSSPQVQSSLGSAFGNLFGGSPSYGAQSSMGYGGSNFSTAPYYSGGGANTSYGFTM